MRAPTVAVTDGEVLALKLVSPSYWAVIALLPCVRAVVVRVAMPPLRVAVPRDVVPLKNATVPVGMPEPGLVAATVAVSVTLEPTVAGFGATVTEVVVLASLTPTESACDVLVVKLVSPA